MVPFYLSPTTRPSPTLSRDAPSVIRARIRTVTGSCIVSSVLVLWLIVEEDNSSLGAGFRLLGWWPVGLLETLRSLFLTAILFLGPLFERGIVEGEWKYWFRRSKLSESLGGWIGWRNYVAVCTFFPFLFFLYFLCQKTQSNILLGPLHRRSHVPIRDGPATFTSAHLARSNRVSRTAVFRHRAHTPLLRVLSDAPRHAGSGRAVAVALPVRLHDYLRLVCDFRVFTDGLVAGRCCPP